MNSTVREVEARREFVTSLPPSIFFDAHAQSGALATSDTVVRLHNKRQREFFERLRGSHFCSLPPCVQDLFEDLDTALDFLNAFIKCKLEGRRRENDKERSWRILGRIRTQALMLSPSRLIAHLDRGYHLAQEGKLLNEVVLLPFCCIPEDKPRMGVRIWDFLQQAMLTEDFLMNPAAKASLAQLMGVLMITQTSTETWRHLIQSAAANDETASRVFHDLVLVLWLLQSRPTFVGYPEFFTSIPGQSLSEVILRLWGNPNVQGSKLCEIPVSPGKVAFCQTFYEEIQAGFEAQMLSLLRKAERFLANRMHYQEEVTQMWHELETDGDWMLSDSGDLVVIKAEGLEDFGFRKILLKPWPGQCFPGTIVQVYYEPLHCGHIFRVERRLNNAEFQLEGGITGHAGTFGIVEEMILKYITVHCLWQICVNKRKEDSPGSLSLDGNGSGNGTGLRRPPRPHTPKLRPRAKMSQRAIDRCIEAGRNLPPPGRTFAKSDLIAPIEVSLAHPTMVYRGEGLSI